MHVIGYVFWKFYVSVKKYQIKLLLNFKYEKFGIYKGN